MMMTVGTRISDGGSTEVTIADGLVYIDIYRNNIHIEQRRYDATDLVNMDIDMALMSGVSTRHERPMFPRAREMKTQENV